MRMKFTALLVAITLALPLGGCFETFTGIPSSVFTTTITHPVGKQEMADIERFYQAGVGVANVYVKLCRSRQIVRETCRPVVVRIQSYIGEAHAALVEVRRFVRNNDTINARPAIAAVRQAIEGFRGSADYQAIAVATQESL